MFLLKDKEDNRMITIEEYYMINCLKNKGMSIMQISREMGVDRKTVSNWLKYNEPPAYRGNVSFGKESLIHLKIISWNE
jgi:IS30 family transposase